MGTAPLRNTDKADCNRDKADNRLAGRDNKAGGIGRNRRDSGADSGAARSSLSLLSTRQSPVRRLSARPRRPVESPPARPAPGLPQRPLLRSMSSSQLLMFPQRADNAR